MNRILHHFLSVIFVCFFGVFATLHNAAGNIYLTYNGTRVPDGSRLVSAPDSNYNFGNVCNTHLFGCYNLVRPDNNHTVGVNDDNNGCPKKSCGTWNQEQWCFDDNEGGKGDEMHIRQCALGNTYNFVCKDGYTRRAVERVGGFEDTYYQTRWRYECRCGPDEYEYFKTNPGDEHPDTDWDFECRKCSDTSGYVSCGYDDTVYTAPDVVFKDFVCPDGYSPVDTGNGFSCGCTGDSYVYVSKETGAVSCKPCSDVYNPTGLTYTCGNGELNCGAGKVRFREDGTRGKPKDSAYSCMSCSYPLEYNDTQTIDVYTGNYKETWFTDIRRMARSNEYIDEEWGNDCSVSFVFRDIERKNANGSGGGPDGAVCNHIDTYEVHGIIPDEYWSYNANLDVDFYTLKKITFTKTEVGSYVEGDNNALSVDQEANALCKKCTGDDYYVPTANVNLQIGACPTVPDCSTPNINNNRIGFTCDSDCYLSEDRQSCPPLPACGIKKGTNIPGFTCVIGCFKAFVGSANGATCYPCPYLGGDNWSNAVFWGLSNNAGYGTMSSDGAESITKCQYSGSNISDKSDLSGSYSWGGTCAVVNSVEPYYDRYNPPLYKTYYSVYIATGACRSSLANCAFGDGGMLNGFFPGRSNTEALGFFNVGNDSHFSMDLSTAQALVRCALNDRSGCGSNANFSISESVDVPNGDSTRTISTSIDLSTYRSNGW